MAGNGKGTFSFVSLGCPKATVDSERMLGLLAQDGYTLVADSEQADVVIVNTCGFIESARQESLDVIHEMLQRKREGKIGAVVVAGCLAERQGDTLREILPEVDQIVGVFAREEISTVVKRALAGQTEQRTLFRPAAVRAMNDTSRLRITPHHYAYLKISEGCDRLCTFCAIPRMRGKHVSKPMDEVVHEARELASDGVRELIIVAQDSTYYGMDLYGQPKLAELLRELDQLDDIEWIRLLYAYPEHISDELLETIATARRILPYVDMPLQHINDRILKRMQRRVNRKQTETLIDRWRRAVPNLIFRTTFIVGFPGETESEFQELCDFVQARRFERVGVFTYSREPDTPADRLDGHLPQSIKQERLDRLMTVQQEAAFAWSRSQVGRELEVMIDTADPEIPGHYLGRSHADAPEIDGLVRVKGKNLRPGDLVRTKIIAADGYDLAARAIGAAR